MTSDELRIKIAVYLLKNVTTARYKESLDHYISEIENTYLIPYKAVSGVTLDGGEEPTYCGFCGTKKTNLVSTDINTPLICPNPYCSKWVINRTMLNLTTK